MYKEWSEERVKLLGKIKHLEGQLQSQKAKNKNISSKLKEIKKKAYETKLKVKRCIFWSAVAIAYCIISILTNFIQNDIIEILVSISLFGVLVVIFLKLFSR